ncbi:hypothetical protein GCM10022238_41510 [Gordonia hankookensis]
MPAESVIVVTSGKVPLSNSDETFSTAEAARLDTTPIPLATGYSRPATNTPASRQAPASGHSFFEIGTSTGYV